MKLKTRKTNLYIGDKTIQIYYDRGDGSTIGIMSLTPYYCRIYGKRMYSNNINDVCFETIKQAKEYCQRFFNKNNIEE